MHAQGHHLCNGHHNRRPGRNRQHRSSELRAAHVGFRTRWTTGLADAMPPSNRIGQCQLIDSTTAGLKGCNGTNRGDSPGETRHFRRTRAVTNQSSMYGCSNPANSSIRRIPRPSAHCAGAPCTRHRPDRFSRPRPRGGLSTSCRNKANSST